MAQRIERIGIKMRTWKHRHQPLLSSTFHRSLAVFVSVLFLSESVAAAPKHYPVKIAQQPAATSQDANRTAAERAFTEADQLFKQGTVQSLQQAIAKYEEALQFWRTVGDRAREVLTLHAATLTNIALFERTQGNLKQGLQPAAALRVAQLEMSQQTQFSSPYFWAAFVQGRVAMR